MQSPIEYNTPQASADVVLVHSVNENIKIRDVSPSKHGLFLGTSDKSRISATRESRASVAPVSWTIFIVLM